MPASTKTIRTGWLSGIAIMVAAAATPATGTSPSAAPDGGSPVPVSRGASTVFGGGTYPGYSLEIPDGWVVGQFTTKEVGGPLFLGISVWDVGMVAGDPCHWSTTTADPGPTVDDLVGAQASRHATYPVEVTLAGRRARYLEWSVPADLVVTGDGDFQGCDVEPSDGHLNFISWFGNGYGERYQQVAGQVDRLWILDVDGQRLLVDATHSPDATAAHLAEQDQIVQSLQFDDA